MTLCQSYDYYIIMNNKIIIGPQIKALRESQGLSQFKLAVLCGLSPDYIYKIENNKVANIGIQKLAQIAEALHVDVKELLNDVEGLNAS